MKNKELQPIPHPSALQRKKLKEAQKKRLTDALRENLRKRKEQMRARKPIP